MSIANEIYHLDRSEDINAIMGGTECIGVCPDPMGNR